MAIVNALEENFKFLVIEVKKQMEDTWKILDNNKNPKLRDKVNSRDDYIDNLKNLIENKASGYFLSSEELDKNKVVFVRALTVIASNLEHMADHSVNIMFQTKHLTKPDNLRLYDYGACFKVIIDAIEMILPAIDEKNISKALEICRVEAKLDSIYASIIRRIIGELRERDDTENLVTILFIFQYFERIGDSILNIGEAIMSIVMGERIKIHQYQALTNTISGLPGENDYDFESVAESRSGNIIRRVKGGSFQERSSIIFKEGKAGKIDKEKENIEIWAGIDSGLAPRIYGYSRSDQNASLALEFLKGRTVKDIIVNADKKHLTDLFGIFSSAVLTLWEKTRIDTPVKSSFLDQLSERIDDVLNVHPNFRNEGIFGEIELISLEAMLQRVSDMTKDFESPFSVLIHGDFNNDNIIINEKKNRIHYIDLHRSKQSDYVQDISVFLVSNFRMPIFDNEIRYKINWVIEEFYRISRTFSIENEDGIFDARLTLGLIRSFITSTRFELNEEFAKLMYLKAIYLLERIMDYKGNDWDRYELPADILAY